MSRVEGLAEIVLWVKDMDRYQHWQAGDTVFLGASLHVMVIGSGNA